MIKRLFSSSTKVIYILGTTLIVRDELKSLCWEMDGQLIEAFMKWSSFPMHLLGFSAAFNKMVITPSCNDETFVALES